MRSRSSIAWRSKCRFYNGKSGALALKTLASFESLTSQIKSARAGAPARPQDHGSRDSQGSARRRAGKKTELAAAIMERSEGRFAMKAVADTLAVARSNLIERVSRRAKSRRPYRKAGDNELLALIRRLVDERPTIKIKQGRAAFIRVPFLHQFLHLVVELSEKLRGNC